MPLFLRESALDRFQSCLILHKIGSAPVHHWRAASVGQPADRTKISSFPPDYPCIAVPEAPRIF